MIKIINFINVLKNDERSKRIVITSLTSVISRVLAILVPLIVVRISIQKLGIESYGLWMTVTSFFSLFTFADLGLGSGLQTKLSSLYGLEDKRKAQILISSTEIVLLLVTTILLFVFILSFRFINWSNVMNAKSNNTTTIVSIVVLAVVLSKITNIPLGLIQRVQYAFQEGYISNLWLCFSSLLSLITIYIVAKMNVAPVLIIWCSSFVPILVAAVNYYIYFYIKHPEYKPNFHLFKKSEASVILKIGIQFMILSILTTLSMSMDSYIFALISGLKSVTPYSLGYRIATVMSVATTMLSTPLWAANGEAISKNDFAWIKKITRNISKLSVFITILCSVIFLAFGNIFINLWIGNKLKISFVIMSGLLFMQIVQSFISPYFMVLNGAGIVKKQIIMFAIYTPLSLLLKYILSLRFGTSYIPWIGSILYLVMISIPTYHFAKKVYENK